jgi:hypothetical protein
MDATALVSVFNQMILQLSSAFTVPTFGTFAQLVVGWVLTPGCGTVSGMIRTLGSGALKHWTVYHKFFYRASWTLDDLSLLLLGRLVGPLLSDVVEVALDDTTCGPRGKHVALAGWWKDASAHAKGPVIHWSHNWVVMAITIRLKRFPSWRITLPVMFALHRKRAHCDDRTPYRTLPQLARGLLVQLSQALPDRLICVAFDGLYATKDLFGDMPPKVIAVTRLRKDASLRTLPPDKGPTGRRRKRGDRLPNLQTLTTEASHWHEVELLKQGRKVRRRITGMTCQWYHVCGLKPVRVVIVQAPDGREDDLHVVCNRADIDDATIVQRYYDRWGIEECIQEAKRHLGMERTRGWCVKTVSRQAPLAMIISSLVKSWYVQHAADYPQLLPKPMPWYPSKPHPSFHDMLSTLRRCLWRGRLFNSQNPCKFDKTYAALEEALCDAA